MPLQPRTGFVVLALILPVIMASPWRIGPEETNAPDYLVMGEASYQNADLVSFLENAKQAVKLAPGNPRYLYMLARAYALRGDEEMAVRCLEKTVRMGFYFTARSDASQRTEDADFSSLAGSEAFRALLSRVREVDRPVLNSEVAFEIHETGLMPEGIAHDPVDRAFYIGSLRNRKIIRIDDAGGTADFAEEKQDGLWGVTGLAVDARRRVLWVNSSALGQIRDFREEEVGSAGVFKYDLKSGRLVNKYILGNRPLHLFNGLAVGSNGDVYITDSMSGTVYRVSEKRAGLELFVRPERFSYPNGIAISDDDRFLFVGHVEGTSVIEIESRSCSLLSHPDSLSLALVDGLSYYRGSLLALQGAHRPQRLVQFFLDPGLGMVRDARILEAGNPRFDFPTSGVVVGNAFYYVANSQSSNQDALIMKVAL